MTNSTVKNTFAERIKILLGRFDNNVSKLSREIGVTPTTVNRWINDGAEPSLSVLNDISNALQVNLYWLMTGKGTPDETIDNAITHQFIHDKSFESRLDFVVEKLGGAVKACQLANITHPTLMRWKEGVSDPKMSNLIAFAQAGEVNLDWLLTGKGTPDGAADSSTIHQSVNDDDYDYVPYADDVFASAGGGRFNDGVVGTDRYLAFRKEWVCSNGFNVKDLVAINTDGDSMLPTIPENATVLIDKSKNLAKDGRIYVVRIDDQLYVKRIQWLPTGLRLISDNKDVYDPIDLSKADLASSNIQIYGQVVHISYDLPH